MVNIADKSIMQPDNSGVDMVPHSQPASPYDARFRALIGSHKWTRLPHAVQRRFAKRLVGSATANYAGTVLETRLSLAGRILAQLCRIIGAPLPLYRDANVPAIVSVSEDGATGGQCWTRIYGRRKGFPQVIHSAKRFAGSTGLEEYVGRGVGMALTVDASDEGLIFTSDHYFIALAGHRIRLPQWLSPGRTVVTHRDLGDGAFAFDLQVRHALFGDLMLQRAVFRDC